MSALNNYIVITGKSHCYRWLYNLNDNLANLIFVEPDDMGRVTGLLESLDVSAVLVHFPSQDISNTTISDADVSPGFSAVLTHLEAVPASGVVPDGNDSSRLSADLELIEELVHNRPTLTVIGLVGAVNQNALLSIMRAGVRDLIKIGTPAHETSAIIARHHKRIPELEKQEKAEVGKITSLLNARADDGTALLALHLALELQHLEPTLLIDFGMPHPDIMVMLGVVAKFNFIDVVNNRTRLDKTLVQTGFAKHHSGLTLIAMPDTTADDAVLTATEMHLALHSLKRYFKHIVINHGGLCNTELLKVSLSLSDSALFVVEQTVPSCKRNYDLLQSLRQQNPQLPKIQIVIDRYLTNVIPTAESIAQSFDLPMMAKLPPSDALRLLTTNTGESICQHAPKSKYVSVIKDIARKIGKSSIDRKIKSPLNFFSKLHDFLVPAKY